MLTSIQFTPYTAWEMIVSADLGQAHDYTAIVLVEVPIWVDPSWPVGATERAEWLSALTHRPEQRALLRGAGAHFGQPSKPPLLVRHIERIRHQSYVKVVERLKELMTGLPGQPVVQLVMDYGGVGRAVFDLAVARGLDPAAVTLTGGDRINGTWPDVRVPKREVIAAAQIALQNGRLRIAPLLQHAQTLIDELRNFRVKISASGHDSYEAREGEHDDLVLSTAQAVWARDWYWAHQDAAIPMPGLTAVGSRT